MILTGATIILLVSAVTISALPLKLNEENSSLLAEDGLFEGDLKIPEAFIRAHYNLSENGTELGSDGSGSAAGHSIDLWVNGIVPYIISCGFSSDKQALIRFAMDRWENITCLQFVPRRSYHSDYIHFQNSDEECYSDSIGRKGGKQIVNLGQIGCETYGIILHEISHAVGFWHEQSRPDRDDYVRINYENIQSGEERQFRKRNDFEIHNQSLPYDYGSIMHYLETAFVNDSCEDCKTIEASNEMAHEAQGSPRLGQINDLTCFDIERMNRLYSCSEPGVCGTLTVVIKYGKNLKDTDKDKWFKKNLPDPYVEIMAFDILGNSESKLTKVKSGTRNPDWDETLRFTGSHLQFFRIKVWDKDPAGNPDDALSKSETVVAIPGFHESQKHCGLPECDGYIMYDYTIV